jgi:hypothetical protein
MTITTEEAERLARCGLDLMDDPPNRDDEILINAGDLDDMTTALRSLAAERDALRSENKKLRARAVKWAGIVGTLIAERDQLIGALQIAVEKSGDMETPPAWVNGACSLLNRGFLKVDRAALGEKE